MQHEYETPKLLLLAALVIGVILILWAGTSDYEEAVRQQQEYCYNVETSVWPDYKETYVEWCEENEND